MEIVFIVIKCIFFAFTTILVTFLGLSFTRLERKKHPILKIATSKRFRFLILIIICVVIGTILSARKDIKDLPKGANEVTFTGKLVPQKSVKPSEDLNVVIGNSEM